MSKLLDAIDKLNEAHTILAGEATMGMTDYREVSVLLIEAKKKIMGEEIKERERCNISDIAANAVG